MLICAMVGVSSPNIMDKSSAEYYDGNEQDSRQGTGPYKYKNGSTRGQWVNGCRTATAFSARRRSHYTASQASTVMAKAFSGKKTARYTYGEWDKA